MVLTISPEHLRVDIVLRMYSIAPAGVDARGNTHWVKIQEKKSLTEVSARYIGAILVGETTSWVNSEAMLLEWMDENGGANNIDIRTRVSANSDIIIHEIHGHTVFFLPADWNNGQWVCNLVGAMSASEHDVVDTVLPENWLKAGVLHDHIQQIHIPRLWRTAGWKNIIGLV